MRIISKFKDYYDGVQYYGQDQDLVYVRNKEYPDEKINLENHFKTDGHYFSSIIKPDIIQYPEKNIEQEYYDSFILGFCGQLYRGYIIKQEEKNPSNKLQVLKEKFFICYNQDELNIFQKNKEYSKKQKKMWTTSYNRNKQNINYFEINNQEQLQELFFKYNTPCFVVSNGRLRQNQLNGCKKYETNLTLNPILSKYEFYRIKDSYTCYQDIAVFIGGVLPRTGNEIIQISDKDIIKKHGFDKWSFRKQSENK